MMADNADASFRERLEKLRSENLYRTLREVSGPQGPRLRMGDREFLNFSSNDYLGLANHPALREAALEAVRFHGVGSGASRLICGSLKPHHDLEAALAAFKQTEAALAFSSGCAAALGAITALVGKGDIVILDKLVHASIVDAARLSGATLRVFKHNDLDNLERILRWTGKARTAIQAPRVLIVTESVFSMDGDLAPLRDIVRLKEEHGAWLMVDEAHATGLFGSTRSGLVEEFDLRGKVDVQLITLGKALGAAGGAICGSRPLVDLLVNQARSFIFSTAPSPASAAAAKAAVELVQTEEGERLRSRLWLVVDRIKSGLIGLGWSPGAVRSAIIPLILGNERRTIDSAEALRERGIYVPGIRYPSVARGQARLRLTASAAHTADDVDTLITALAQVLPAPSKDSHA
jgi:8-amino-7-oxononanoate synthase